VRTAALHAGDPIECCVRGVKFAARFDRRDRGEVLIRPLPRWVTYRRVSPRQIVRKLTEREVMS